jgi:hypothetical protein
MTKVASTKAAVAAAAAVRCIHISSMKNGTQKPPKMTKGEVCEEFLYFLVADV